MANPARKGAHAYLPTDHEGHSAGTVLRELGTSAKDLIQSEMELARAELKETAARLGRHSAQAATFGALCALSVFPFLAFLVIGLGRLFGDNYWLSSLVVSALCALVGGPLAYRAFKRMREENLTLPHTQLSLHQSRERISEAARIHPERRAS